LVAKRVAANDDGLFPAGYEAGNGRNDDGRAENGSSSVNLLGLASHLCKCDLQVISDGAVGRQPHLLELELLDSLLIRCDSRALDTNRVLLDSLGGIESDLVVGLITVGQTKIVVLEVNVQIWVNELVI
jgi:hypothetical protein